MRSEKNQWLRDRLNSVYLGHSCSPAFPCGSAGLAWTIGHNKERKQQTFQIHVFRLRSHVKISPSAYLSTVKHKQTGGRNCMRCIPRDPEDRCPGSGWKLLCGSCSWLPRLWPPSAWSPRAPRPRLLWRLLWHGPPETKWKFILMLGQIGKHLHVLSWFMHAHPVVRLHAFACWYMKAIRPTIPAVYCEVFSFFLLCILSPAQSQH